MELSPGVKRFFMRSEYIGARVIRPFQSFAQLEIAGGILLVAATAAALWWANSSHGDLYHRIMGLKLGITIGATPHVKDLHFVVNEILMTIFFLVIGLEVKRELLVGELASPRKAALPALAALGGVAVPALIYYAFNAGGPAEKGWGIPMATDIAFVLGALALLGKRTPQSLGVFLVSLAIVDDLVAVMVIALFYTGQIVLSYLAVGLLGLLALVMINLLGFRHPIPYIILAVVVWAGIYLSGIHATIAGVLVALAIPCRSKVDKYSFAEKVRELIDRFEAKGERDFVFHLSEANEAVVRALERLCLALEPPLQRLEHTLHPWCAFLIIPLFALANAGVEIDSGSWFGMVSDAQGLGIILGLFVGKPVGIFGATWLAVKARIVDLPRGVQFKHVYGGAILCGIGFTMSLFIAGLSFGGTEMLGKAKLAVLLASFLCAVVGTIVLALCGNPSGAHAEEQRAE